MAIPLSILDLAFKGHGKTASEAFEGCVALAQLAERVGYQRVWYAEHHNIPTIASSATSVLIAHVAAHTRTIRLGAGGIMLPNHSPLVIAEQFGSLEALHPGRIDLGLGRAPGTDQTTWRALRRDIRAADTFPDDVVELQGYLSDESLVPGVEATPGKGSRVPLYILGSSLFGAQLAAVLGLPYAFASHFAPDALFEAVELYRREYRGSVDHPEPWFIAGVNAIAADSEDEARQQMAQVKRARVRALLGRGRPPLDDAAVELVLSSPEGQRIEQMVRYSAVGTPQGVRAFLGDFARQTGADELMVVHPSPTLEARLRSAEMLAEAWGLEPRG